MLKKLIIVSALVVPIVLIAMQVTKPSIDEEVTVKTQDNINYKVPYNWLRHSTTLYSLIQDVGTESLIPVPNISSEVWLIIQNQLKDVDSIVNKTEVEIAHRRIQANLKELSVDQLIKFIQAINYLDIPELLQPSLVEAINRDITLITFHHLMGLPKDLRNKIVIGQINKLIGSLLVKEFKVLKGHADSVKSVCVTPDGTKVVSSSVDNTIRIWDLSAGKEINVLNGLKSYNCPLCVTPDGSKIISGSYNAMQIWDLTAGKIFKVIQIEGAAVCSVCVTPNGNNIVAGLNDETVRIWDLATGEELKVLYRHGDAPVTAVCVTSDGSKIVSAASDNAIIVAELATGKKLKVIEAEVDYDAALCVTVKGKIVSGRSHNAIQVWELATGKYLGVLKGETGTVKSVSGMQEDRPGRLNSVCAMSDGTKIVSGSSDMTVGIWSMITGKLLNLLKGHTGSVNSVCVTPDGSKIVSGSDDMTIRIWDILNIKSFVQQLGDNQLNNLWAILQKQNKDELKAFIDSTKQEQVQQKKDKLIKDICGSDYELLINNNSGYQKD